MDKKKSFAYKMGYAVGVIAVLCVTTIVVASTIKFLLWIF
jgi:hypothetical protein